MTKRKASQPLHQTPKRARAEAKAPPSPTLKNHEIASLASYFSNQSPEEIATFCTDVVEDKKEADNVSNNMLRIFKQKPNPQTYNALMGTFHLGKNDTTSAMTHWCFNIFSPLIKRATRLRLNTLTALLIEKKETHSIQKGTMLNADICTIIASYNNQSGTTIEEKCSEPTRLIFSA